MAFLVAGTASFLALGPGLTSEPVDGPSATTVTSACWMVGTTTVPEAANAEAVAPIAATAPPAATIPASRTLVRCMRLFLIPGSRSVAFHRGTCATGTGRDGTPFR